MTVQECIFVSMFFYTHTQRENMVIAFCAELAMGHRTLEQERLS